MTALRPIDTGDIPDIIRAAQAMLQESDWRHFGLDAQSVDRLARRVILDRDKPRLGLIARNPKGDVSGIMAAEIDDLEWVVGRRAINIFTFVPPQNAGSLIGPRLIRAFLDWAQRHQVDAVEFGVSSGVRLDSSDRLLRALGFQPVQGTYLTGESRY
ncbi:hypothetical protein [Actibacterium ureilyticum]|uniref:hypothetical protein n=1 Tax=Actibacterium ureilyticum TaxID=1590614 RepID=UPI000BAAD01E|nr:hypothetical protein [Actibacterium ureilyticum]